MRERASPGVGMSLAICGLDHVLSHLASALDSRLPPRRREPDNRVAAGEGSTRPP